MKFSSALLLMSYLKHLFIRENGSEGNKQFANNNSKSNFDGLKCKWISLYIIHDFNFKWLTII